jgi:hypothetical protein
MADEVTLGAEVVAAELALEKVDPSDILGHCEAPEESPRGDMLGGPALSTLAFINIRT